MHALFENVVPMMFRHWNGAFFKGNQAQGADYILPGSAWKEMGHIMESNRKNMPLDFGRPLINIQRHSAAFKAEEWSNWVQLYSLPLLQQFLPERCLRATIC